MIDLQPMEKASYDSYRKFLDTLFADQTREAYETNAFPIEGASALDFSRRTLNTLIPNGYESPNCYFLNILDGARVVGNIWYAMQKEFNTDIVFLRYVHIEESFRRKGYAKAAIRKFIDKIKADHNVENIQLNVYAFNKNAQALYRALGFEPFKTTMSLKMTG